MPTPTKTIARATKRITTKAANEPTLKKKQTEVKAKRSSQPAKTSAKEAPVSPAVSVKIFQIHYKGDQKEYLDPAFTELDNREAEAETHEFAVFEKLFSSKQVKGFNFWGAVSWRFGQKTGLTGEQLISVVKKHSKTDVFYMNPYPYNEALFQSGWMQGETVHPDFLMLSEKVLVAAGFDSDEVHRVSNSAAFSSANYFVGNQKFWSAYIAFVQKLLADAETNLPPSILKTLHSSKADARNLHNQSTYVPFIVERLFPLFMKSAGQSLTASKISLPAQEKKLNEHLRKLREMKDAAVKTKSEWLLRSWMSYRNLYLQTTAPKEWCEKYLRALNPKEIVW